MYPLPQNNVNNCTLLIIKHFFKVGRVYLPIFITNYMDLCGRGHNRGVMTHAIKTNTVKIRVLLPVCIVPTWQCQEL